MTSKLDWRRGRKYASQIHDAIDNGQVPIAMGAQTTATAKLVALAKEAERIGVECVRHNHVRFTCYEFTISIACLLP